MEEQINENKCSECGKSCSLKDTLYKIHHEEKLYCFDSLECKNEFQKKEFGEVLY